MNPFKRISILSICILLKLVFSCAGQSTQTQYYKRTPEEKARYFTKKMVDSITVNQAQEEALYEMNIIVSQKFDSLNAFVNNLEAKERSAAYRSIYAYRDSCMKVILPIKEFLRFQDIERERYEAKKKKTFNNMKKEE